MHSEIKSIKNNSDIVKVISYFVDIKRDGANFTGKCPFHDERSKSFVVSNVRQRFKCFGCGAQGDAIDFVIKHKSFTYKLALEWIANFENITIDKEYKEYSYIEPETSYLPKELITKSNNTNFDFWLKSLTDKPHDYITSASKFWNKSVVFWYIDAENKIRSGKIMQYNPITGKRIKEPKPLVNWVHKVLNLKDFNLDVCLFGEYLLKKYPNKKVGIVESEKTAIIASIALPNLVWLASGSLSYLNYKRCKVLEGRNIILYPDVGAEERWTEKINQLRELMPQTKWQIKSLKSDVKGYDLCDYIIDNKLL